MRICIQFKFVCLTRKQPKADIPTNLVFSETGGFVYTAFVLVDDIAVEAYPLQMNTRLRVKRTEQIASILQSTHLRHRTYSDIQTCTDDDGDVLFTCVKMPHGAPVARERLPWAQARSGSRIINTNNVTACAYSAQISRANAFGMHPTFSLSPSLEASSVRRDSRIRPNPHAKRNIHTNTQNK